MRRPEGPRARRERRQRAEARLPCRLVQDAARLVAHRGGPRFGSQSRSVNEGDAHAPHVPCRVCTNLSRGFVDMSLSLLGCLLCGRPFWTMEASSLLERAVRPVSLFDPEPALFVEKALPSCSSLFPSTSPPSFLPLKERLKFIGAVAEGVPAWNEQFL